MAGYGTIERELASSNKKKKRSQKMRTVEVGGEDPDMTSPSTKAGRRPSAASATSLAIHISHGCVTNNLTY